VTKGLKAGDVDPRGNLEYCYTISDKGRTISGGVLEAILAHFNG
jgi:xanthine dehydrogenase accessory factor